MDEISLFLLISVRGLSNAAVLKKILQTFQITPCKSVIITVKNQLWHYSQFNSIINTNYSHTEEISCNAQLLQLMHGDYLAHLIRL